jgi:short subunit dehydrogenase-like uncharacterized protein
MSPARQLQEDPASQPPPSLEIVGLPSPLERDGRSIPQASKSTFWGMLVVAIPLWLTFVAPLIVLYQAFARILRLVLPAPKHPPLDSGIQPPKDLKPLQDRTYDIVVLGVTGFTGRLAARHLAKQYGVNSNSKSSIKWAIAGRSQAKLDAVKKFFADELEMPKLLQIDTIRVDTSDPSTMPALVQDTRVVATTAGPYQEYGNAVVEFCAKFGTHYVDITGEVGWVKTMFTKWHATAQETGAKIIPFCGHDSIPWEMTVLKLNMLLRKEFKDDLKTVKVWDEVIGAAPGGTFQTVLLNLEGRGIQPPRCEIDPFLQTASGEKSTHTTIEDLPALIEPFFDARWTSPFVMAVVNAKVIRWSLALMQQGSPKISYRECAVHKDFYTAFCGHFGQFLLGSLLLNPFTKWLAFRFLLPQPGQGPSLKSMEETNYLLVTAEGIGEEGNRVETTLYFPKDPGCLETSRMMIESGLCLAMASRKGEASNSENKLPSGNKGGFWPPAAALGDVLLERLLETGAEFNFRAVPKLEEKDSNAKLKTM